MRAEGTKMPEPIRAFAEHAKAEGHDTAYTYDTERSRWVFLNPMTADLWRYWQEATRLAMERAEREILEFVALLDAQHRPSGAVIRANLLPRIRALSDVACAGGGK